VSREKSIAAAEKAGNSSRRGTNCNVDLDNASYIVDGGFLLHRVIWQAKETFFPILKKYVDYVKDYYNKGKIII